VLSTNKAFSEWSEVFPHAACTVTLVDRLVHRSEIIEVDGESYRLKEAKERAAQRTASRKGKKSAVAFVMSLRVVTQPTLLPTFATLGPIAQVARRPPSTGRRTAAPRPALRRT
jgi:hypothetical protein